MDEGMILGNLDLKEGSTRGAIKRTFLRVNSSFNKQSMIGASCLDQYTGPSEKKGVIPTMTPDNPPENSQS